MPDDEVLMRSLLPGEEMLVRGTLHGDGVRGSATMTAGEVERRTPRAGQP